MGIFEQKPSPQTVDDVARLAADRELLAAVLDVALRLELDDQMRVLLEHASGWVDATGGLAFGPTEERDALAVRVQLPRAGRKALPGLRAVDGTLVRHWVGERPHVFEGLGPFAAVAAKQPSPAVGTTIAVPLGGTVDWSALLLLFTDSSPGAGQVERLFELAQATERAVRNALQVLAIRELVIKDDTAQCYNRRYFETSLPDELSRASRFHASLSLIFLDMDNLKQVNNRYGHAMGSRTLLEVSRRIRSKIRRFDKLFRFGGDEFCILLPETEWEGALEVAERVRDAIVSKPFLVDQLDDGDGVRMSASLGIAAYPLHASTQKALVEQADRAMQRIKSGSKNAVGIAEVEDGR